MSTTLLRAARRRAAACRGARRWLPGPGDRGRLLRWPPVHAPGRAQQASAVLAQAGLEVDPARMS